MRLDIPMGQSKTARRSRRAVWILATGGLFLAILGFVGTRAWFGMDQLTGSVPDDAIYTIHLSPTAAQWRELVEDFGNMALINNRPLTMRHLDNWKIRPRELALFGLQNGHQGLLLRLPKLEATKELDALGIVHQGLGKHAYGLSGTVLPYNTGSSLGGLGSVWPHVVGSIRIQNIRGSVTMTEDGYRLSLPILLTKNSSYLPTLPSHTIAAVRIEKGTQIQERQPIRFMNELLAASEAIQPRSLQQALEEYGGTIAFFDEHGLQTVIEIDSGDVFDVDVISRSLKNFLQPKTRDLSLPNGQTAKEIILENVDPSEQKLDPPVIVSKTHEKTMISTSVDALKAWESRIDTKKSLCLSERTMLYVEPAEIVRILGEHASTVTNSLLAPMSVLTQSVSISQSKSIEKLHFCI